MFNRLTERIRPHLLPFTCLLVATVMIYGRMLWHDFQVSWDDYRYVLNNSMVHGLSIEHIRQAFAAPFFGNYAPLHLISYMLDFEMWQLFPGGYMLTNLLLHGLNGLLLYMLIIRLHVQRLMATVATAFFMLHPLQVETVAWVSQRKNLLAMLFFLFALLCYISYRETYGNRRFFNYCCSVLLFFCAVFSKSVAVILPVVLVLYDCCFADGKINPKHTPLFKAGRFTLLIDKIPYGLVALVAAVLTIQSQAPVGDNWDSVGGGIVGFHGGGPLATFFSMLPVFCRYLGLLVWPSGLNARYNPAIHTYPDISVLTSGLFLVLVGWLCYRLFRYDRKLGFWMLVFWVGFLPVSQIVPLVTMMNDRYVYFPMLGFAVLVGAGCQHIRGMLSGSLAAIFYTGVTALIVLMSVTTFQRVGIWRDSIVLWSDSVSKLPGLTLSWTFLAQAYERTGTGMINESIEAYKRALALDRSNNYALYGLGRAYSLIGQYDKALQYNNSLLRLSPDHVMGLTQLGVIYEGQGRYDLAEKAYLRAEKLQPEAVEVAMQLARLSMLRGDLVTARRRFVTIENGPEKHPEVAYILAWFEAREGNAERALVWLEIALKRGYAEDHPQIDTQEFAGLQDDPRLVQLLQRYYGGNSSRGQ